MTEPAEADLARDAEADLCVCEAATPGPYPVKRTIHSIPYIPNVAQFTNFDPHERVYLPAEENCAFLVLAREALPAWIRRAEHYRLLAESKDAEVKRLQQHLRDHVELDQRRERP
jgi:hypothetical protein